MSQFFLCTRCRVVVALFVYIVRNDGTTTIEITTVTSMGPANLSHRVRTQGPHSLFPDLLG
jgi:hypothetical protein